MQISRQVDYFFFLILRLVNKSKTQNIFFSPASFLLGGIM